MSNLDPAQAAAQQYKRTLLLEGDDTREFVDNIYWKSPISDETIDLSFLEDLKPTLQANTPTTTLHLKNLEWKPQPGDLGFQTFTLERERSRQAQRQLHTSMQKQEVKSITTSVSVGTEERMKAAIAPLPPPPVPVKVSIKRDSDEKLRPVSVVVHHEHHHHHHTFYNSAPLPSTPPPALIRQPINEPPPPPPQAPPTETKPTETRPTETKPTETKPTETKPTETKPTETRPTETKPTEAKPTETKPASSSTLKSVTMVALGDAWVTKEAYDLEMQRLAREKLQEQEDAKKQQQQQVQNRREVVNVYNIYQQTHPQAGVIKNGGQNGTEQGSSILTGFSAPPPPVVGKVVGILGRKTQQQYQNVKSAQRNASGSVNNISQRPNDSTNRSNNNTTRNSANQKMATANTTNIESPRWTSDSTLHHQPSVEDILGEPNEKSSSPSNNNANVLSQTSKSQKVFSMTFRYLNLLRSLLTVGFSIYTASIGLRDPYYQALGAKPLMGALIFFSVVDCLIAFTKSFPKTLWCFWSTRSWDPFAKVYTPLALIMDHDLLLDLLPLTVNVVLKVYSYRLAEVVEDPEAREGITSVDWGKVDVTSAKYWNFIQLLIFVASIVSTVLFHAFRLLQTLIKKRAVGLGLLVVLKSFLVLWDILTNNLLLYTLLTTQGVQLFQTNIPTRILLSIVVVSPAVTLATNVLVNLPLNYSFLKMQLQKLDNTEEIKGWRVWKGALRRTFEPVVWGVCGTFTLYSLFGIIYTLTQLNYFNPIQDIQNGTFPSGILPTSTFFGWANNNADANAGDVEGVQKGYVLIGMVWVNVVANYLVGSLAGVGYWVFCLIAGVVGY
ncbi:hypothetical protein HDV05_003777 [Chytridiales sp. JEL 0842]|nr:hypothetical protein HDV05_003777 [Chytridiales sp. JEL 0842]